MMGFWLTERDLQDRCNSSDSSGSCIPCEAAVTPQIKQWWVFEIMIWINNDFGDVGYGCDDTQNIY